MNKHEKFVGIKNKMIEENERRYGQEIREKYGQDTVEKSNAKLMGLTVEQFCNVQELSNKINELLKEAFEQGDPSSKLAQKVCSLHQEWLEYFWNQYSKEAHLSLAQTYVIDPRFKKYYDDIAIGCAEFLFEAIKIYCM